MFLTVEIILLTLLSQVILPANGQPALSGIFNFPTPPNGLDFGSFSTPSYFGVDTPHVVVPSSTKNFVTGNLASSHIYYDDSEENEETIQDKFIHAGQLGIPLLNQFLDDTSPFPDDHPGYEFTPQGPEQEQEDDDTITIDFDSIIRNTPSKFGFSLSSLSK
eukprot:TRINITY_DN3229_c0_g1_i1.p3 TRINITY_DN3229_c0_g1~~TRINITY_DN3229_c0_g1_i1.p3  ORF type:complete len:185 (-),score=8.26 TRINITY_DN3229_c0_g1_i1:1431-1916(-)